jgi:hypothetical protein
MKQMLLPLLLCFIGVGTTWLIIGIYRFEVARSQSLVEYLINNNISGEIGLISEPDLYHEWPTMERTIGFRLDGEGTVNLALDSKRRGRIRVNNSTAATILFFDRNLFQWRIIP